MNEQIEIFDQQIKKYRKGAIWGSMVFFIAWLSRSMFKIFDLQTETLHTIVYAILILSICFQAYFAMKLNIIKNKIRKDSVLREALHNEWIRLNELKAWRVAFFATILFIILIGILSLYVPIKDTMLIVITALLVGFGAYNVTVHILDK